MFSELFLPVIFLLAPPPSPPSVFTLVQGCTGLGSDCGPDQRQSLHLTPESHLQTVDISF